MSCPTPACAIRQPLRSRHLQTVGCSSLYPSLSDSIPVPIMSSFIEIPKSFEARQSSAKAQSPLSSSSSTYSTSPQTPSSATSSKSSQKRKAVHKRRESLLSMLSLTLYCLPDIAVCLISSNMCHALIGDALSKSETTTINIGDPDGPPRLVSDPLGAN